MSNECVEYSAMVSSWFSTVATWVAAVATWAAVGAAIWAGRWAKETLETQRGEIEKLNRAAQREAHLARLRNGPFFTVIPRPNEAPGKFLEPQDGKFECLIRLPLEDVRKSILGCWKAAEIGSSVTKSLKLEGRAYPDGNRDYTLAYVVDANVVNDHPHIQVEIRFITDHGIEDIHVYELGIGEPYFIRISPTVIPVHERVLAQN